jgi:hypothetical protein
VSSGKSRCHLYGLTPGELTVLTIATFIEPKMLDLEIALRYRLYRVSRLKIKRTVDRDQRRVED